jgi:predicted ATP-dependent endonuclease of OLD family
MAPAKEFLESDFSETEVTFKKFADTFKEKCGHNSAGLANDFEPILDIYNLNWFYKTLQIHVKENFPDKSFDSEEVGAGMQNLLMISIFQTYSELMGGRVIFGIEEPEIYLYPQAQRSLYKSFIKLSEKSQIFYTTHNPNFVDASRADDIVLLRKNADEGTYKLKKDDFFNTENASKEGLKYKIYTHFNPERNELFFAKKVLFVEGDSDKILFETLCEEKWNVDLDGHGISIIACGGKGGVNYFLGVCKLIGFEDYFSVWDEDPEDESYAPEKDFLPDVLLDGSGLEIKGNLEKFLKLPSSKDAKKVKNANEWALNVLKKDIPEEFMQIKNFMTTQN